MSVGAVARIVLMLYHTAAELNWAQGWGDLVVFLCPQFTLPLLWVIGDQASEVIVLKLDFIIYQTIKLWGLLIIQILLCSIILKEDFKNSFHIIFDEDVIECFVGVVSQWCGREAGDMR